MFKKAVSLAVDTSRAYLKAAKARGEWEETLLDAKNALAYDLASQAEAQDWPEALRLADEVEKGVKGDLLYLETVAWVLVRCTNAFTKKRARGDQLIRDICRNSPDQRWVEELKTKYRARVVFWHERASLVLVPSPLGWQVCQWPIVLAS